MIIKSLYDLELLLDVDSKEENTIITPDLYYIFKHSKPELYDFLKNSIKKLVSGEVYLITNNYFTQKIYVLYVENAGLPWVKILQYIDMDKGSRTDYTLTKGDYDVLKSYGLFKDDTDIAFFSAVQEYPFFNEKKLNYTTDSNVIADAMNKMNLYLQKGLWFMKLEFGEMNNWTSSLEKLNVINLQKVELDFTGPGENHMATYNNLPLLIKKTMVVGDSTSPSALYIVGPYTELKELYTKSFINNKESVIFGAGYFYGDAGIVTPMLQAYLDLAKPVSTPSIDDKKIIDNIVKTASTEFTPVPEPEAFPKEPELEKADVNFWDKNEELFKEALKEDKTAKKKKRKSDFKVMAPISEAEKNIAQAAVSESKAITPEPTVTLKKRKLRSLTDEIQAAQKEKQIIESTSITYPHDWDYIYSLTECSNFYNLTRGYVFKKGAGKWVIDETQTKGMSIEDWNAYFISHPELSYLIDPILGQFGGLMFTEEQLRESGHLLYNPKTQKLQYLFEYLKGNAYNLLEELEAVKEVVEQLYGDSFYSKQVETISTYMPTSKSIDDPNPENHPFIHPLDEVVATFKLNTAANMTFSRSLNSRDMKAVMNNVKTNPNSAIDIEAYGSELQSLPIIIFFQKWLETQYGKLAAYGLPGIEIVQASYFKGLSFKKFADEFFAYNYKFDEAVTESDFFEVKDNVKRFVNDLFQEFIKTQITVEDRANLDKQWNKRYNGFINLDVYKFPIFIRHSKYFKDRNKARFLELTQTQVEGIKFATINNGSIMAHETGYGKAQPLDAKILTPTGWVNMGNIKKGDFVIAQDGNPTKVNGIYPQGEKEIYKVTFDDGSSTECCEEHLWATKDVHDRSDKLYSGDWKVKSLKQLIDRKIKNTDARKKFSIPVVKPVHFDEQELPIHPYLLGALIGDGGLSTMNTIIFTTKDKEILEQCKLYAGSDILFSLKKDSLIDYRVTRNKSKNKGRSNKILNELRKLELSGKKSNHKFLPDIYKFNSIQNRILLLQGLMDTDGTTKVVRGKNSSQLTYTTVSEKLAEDFIFLIRSLGGITTIYKRKPKFIHKGVKKEGQLAYTININLPANIIPFTLERKLAKHIPKHKYLPSRFIDKIELVGKKQAQCISVEHEDHLYITDDFIVTHNTLVSIGYISHCFEINQANNIMVLVPKSLYVNKKWKEEVSGDYDAKRNKFIIGAIPQYNIIEMGNFTPQSIFEEKSENEDRQYKNYTDDEVRSIQKYDQFLTEIGGKKRFKDRRPGTATLPTSPYGYRMAVVSSSTSWTKIIDTISTMDKPLYYRVRGERGEELNNLLNIFANFDIGSNAKEKKENIIKLVDELSKASFYYREWVPSYGTIPMDLEANPFKKNEWLGFWEKETASYGFEKDEKGKLVYETNSEGQRVKVPLPYIKVAEQYVLSTLEDIHTWISSILIKMYGFAIYEYGEWKFQSAQHNIILATRDSLAYLGFSTSSREDVQKIVSEITTYQNETDYDSDRVENITFVDDNGQQQVFKRDPEVVLQKQLELLMDKISTLMTEEGEVGKFLLNNLKIDGFVLDEAHIAKKVFTNVKIASSLVIPDETGKLTKINTSSHDIKGVAASNLALRVFACCQYIRSLGENKPVMLLTATPFSNQPTEIFTMLSMVGIKQLREQGISNIKNFFDLFLKENLKYDFDHTGEFIKRISVEEFRNKEILLNVIWSVIDIKREASLDKKELLKQQQEDSDNQLRPIKVILPKLISDTSKEMIELDEKNGDVGLSECQEYMNISTVAVVNRSNINTSSIVDRNDVQKQMMDDIEKVVTNTPNPSRPLLDSDKKPMTDKEGKGLFHAYTFDDICPNAELFTEIEEEEEAELERKKPSKKRQTKKEQAQEEAKAAAKVSKSDEKGKVFKALGLSRSIALSPYLFNCNTLPEPTPENLIKYSPKLEYLVKAVESVKNHHIFVIPEKIKKLEASIAKLKAKSSLNEEDNIQLKTDLRTLSHLRSSTEVSGQVAYFNILRFNYYSRDKSGKAIVKQYNIADLLKEYLVKKGVFNEDEIAIYSSDTSKENKENYIKDFQEGKIKFFIGTPSMREGVDLQNKATTLYVMTPDWNPTDMRQVEGRIWRRDNENKFVRIVYVLLDQSIEVFIYAKLEEKARRLQQIMKERNTVAELEEMSLNPNQTKVALASDPIKRADIITKLCEIILVEKRNKISRSREELNKMSDQMDEIITAVETVKDIYLTPFYTEYPLIIKARNAYKQKEIIEMYVNEKEKFVNNFAARPELSKITDPSLNDGLNLVYYDESRDRTLNFFKTNQMEVVTDVLNGMILMIQNNELFKQKSNVNYSGRIDAYNGLNPVMLAPDSYSRNKVYTCLFASVTTEQKRLYKEDSGIKLFEGMRVVNMPSDVQAVILKELTKLTGRTGTISRQNIIDGLDSLADKVVKMMKEYVMNHPEVRPENYAPYVEIANTGINIVTVEEFDQKDLFGKINVIKDMQMIIKNQAIPAWLSLSKENQKKVLAGSPENPTLAQIIPVLNLQDMTKGGTTELDKIIAPISDLSEVMSDVNENFLKIRNLTISDLPELVEQFENDYKHVNDNIKSLEVTKKKLIEKFTDIANMRKSVTIDHIVSKFAETNNYLESKMSYALKA